MHIFLFMKNSAPSPRKRPSMTKLRTIIFFSGVIALFLLSSPLYAAKLTPVGSGTKFWGTASVSVSISGPRYGTNGINDPITPDFSESGSDTITFDDGEAFRLKQAIVRILDDVENSYTYNYNVIDVDAIISSNQGLGATWYDSGGSAEGEAGAGDESWVEDYANYVSLSVQIFNAGVKLYYPSYRKYVTDVIDGNNDRTSISIIANAGQETDSAQFTIEPTLLEQIGDEIQVTIRNNTPWIEFSNYNGTSAFTTSATTSGTVKINGAIVSETSSGNPVIITAQIGDIVTLSSHASLSTGIADDYQVPTPDPSSSTDYPLHGVTVSKGLNVQVDGAAGVSEENPIIGNAGKTVDFPAVPIESSGPGIDVPVWFRTPDGTALEIQVEEPCLLSAFEMPGDLPVGPQPGPVEGSVEVWYDDSGTWVEHEWSPAPPGVTVTFPAGVTRIQLRGIDRTAPDPADNLFNAGLYFDGATTGAQVTISDVSILAPCGDVSGDSIVDLTDLILVLQVLSGTSPISHFNGDCNSDGKIGMNEGLIILQTVSNE